MSATRRALLIASPFQGLRGPLNDVDTMRDVLSEQRFNISFCCGESATRQGILEAWRRIIDATTSVDDIVVIYYSGHGGIVEDSIKYTEDKTEDVSAQQLPWRYQFLVPVDFRSNLHRGSGVDEGNSFTGILDAELAHLLRATTDRTPNVTVILDCCHSGRMARDPSRSDAVPRNLPEVQHANIARHLTRLRAAGQIPTETLHVLDNEHAVRIAAAASKETAWEYRDQNGQWVGLMTQALSSALRDAWRSESDTVSWRTMLLRVRELVNIDFPQQNPQVEGPDTRLLFSLDQAATNALVLKPAGGGAGIIEAGRVSGVRENNVYALMPFGAEQPSDRMQIGTAIITHVIGLKARAELSLAPGKSSVPKEGVLAFLVEEALYEWPVTCPEKLDSLRNAINQSKYLRHRTMGHDSNPLVNFWQDGQSLILSTDQGVQLASQHIADNEASLWANASQYLVKKAEQLARAQHLKSLACDDASEKLEHDLTITFGTVKDGRSDKIIGNDGSGCIIENDLVYISLKNNGAELVYISVFDINVAGQISLISRSYPGGVELPSGRVQILGSDEFGLGLRGLRVKWPETDEVPKTQTINEHLVLIITDSPVDLRYLANANAATRGYAGPSSLERLAFRLATGKQRNIASDSRSMRRRYDTLHIPFTVRPCELWGNELPTPEEMGRGVDLVPNPPYLDQTARGVVGAIFRTARGIPPCVWVVNEHDEDILVVVSKYRPNLMLSGGGVTVSPTGVGFDLNSTSFLSPACKKYLAARSKGKGDSTGVFPLWTRKEGFGVVSIFTGPEDKLYVENERIPLGATAFFSGKPNLRMMDYQGKEVTT